jgi:glyoxylase-like metal-dependent hydrolase (beta-lactamase superfamily II)
VKIHHLNCGTMREVDPGNKGPGYAAAVVNHCLLIEFDEGRLVLVDTGFGTGDIVDPPGALGQTFLARTQPKLRSAEVAANQIRAIGLNPADLTDIILTHLDVDHSGGLPDFPDALVHVHEAELKAALSSTHAHPEHDVRYRPAHWAHGPKWVEYASSRDLSWFGMDAIQLLGIPSDIVLVPLAGHTEGHCADAVRNGERWILHAGDAFYHHGEIDVANRWTLPIWEQLEEVTEVDRPLRLGNHARLRELVRDFSAEIDVISAHDPWMFERSISDRLTAVPVSPS